MHEIAVAPERFGPLSNGFADVWVASSYSGAIS